MPFAGWHARIDYEFAVAGSEEIAVTSLNIGNALGLSQETAVDLQEGLRAAAGTRTAFAALMTTTELGWASWSRWVSTTYRVVPPSGASPVEPIQVVNAPAGQGSKSGVALQDTVVLSLRSGQTIGKANYGKMYLPHTRPTNTTTPHFGGAQAIADAGGTFIEAINDAATSVAGGLLVIIASNPAVGIQAAKPVTQVLVGDLIDTQRRRRNKEQEVYATAGVS